MDLSRGNLGSWNIDLSLVIPFFAYAAILVFLSAIVLLIFKCLGVCDGEIDHEEIESTITETDHLILDKKFQLAYGTDDQQQYKAENLYDVEICVICYAMPRDCFFIPCGHNATCHECAQRIVYKENKLCPICRRLIHKVRKLVIHYNSIQEEE